MKSLLRKIGSFAKVKGGKRLPKGMTVLDDPTEHPYLRVVDFGSDGIDRSNIKYIDKETFDHVKRYTISDSDIYISIAGTIGRVGIVPDDLSGSNLTENAAKITNISTDIDHRYLMYYLRGPLGQSAIQNRTGGTSQPKLALYRIANIDFPFKPLMEQQAIASILTSYDDMIENNRRRIQILEQAARLLYKEWFVHLRFPGHEHTKIIDGVPAGWEKKPLGALLTLQRGFDLPVSRRKEGCFPIYASTGINGYHAEAKVKGPGVVTGRSGSLGTVMFVSGDFWPLNTTLWIKEFKLVGPHYANHLLANMKLEQYNGGAAVPTLNRNDVHRVEVLSPPSLLLRMFEDQSHDIAKQIDALTSMNLKLSEARDLLLPKLMTGEVVV